MNAEAPQPMVLQLIGVAAAVLGGFVILRHHENIKRLLKGTESKFSRKPPA